MEAREQFKADAKVVSLDTFAFITPWKVISAKYCWGKKVKKERKIKSALLNITKKSEQQHRSGDKFLLTFFVVFFSLLFKLLPPLAWLLCVFISFCHLSAFVLLSLFIHLLRLVPTHLRPQWQDYSHFG